MQSLRKNERGVEPVIAALLLIAIAVAAAVVTYSWVMGMISSQGSQAQTSIRIDVIEYNATDNTKVYVTIRNTGTVSVKIDNVYVTDPNGKVDTLVIGDAGVAGKFNATSQFIASKAYMRFECKLNTSPIGSFTVGVPYVIKGVTDNGFSVEQTAYK